MATIGTNSFTSYILTDREQLEGILLTLAQKQVLQTQRAIIAEEKLALEFDPEHPLLFQQQEAFKRGQLEFVTYLLEASDAAELELSTGKFNSTDNSEE